LIGVSVSAAFIALRSIVIVDLLGIEKLTSAFGLLALFQGIVALVGLPISGKFHLCYSLLLAENFSL